MRSAVNLQIIGSPAGEAREDSVSRCESALELMLTQRGNPALEVEQVLADDPESVCAHCLRMALIVRSGDTAARPALAESIAAIEAASLDSDDRARRHAAAARASLEGKPAIAIDRYNAIVADWPHDILALAAAHALDFRL